MISGRAFLLFCSDSLRPSVSKLPTIDANNGLSPGRYKTIIHKNAGLLLIRLLQIHISSEIYAFSLKKMHLNMSGKLRPFCLDLNIVSHSNGRYKCALDEYLLNRSTL